MKVKLYIEGGGERASLHSECRQGFRKLFEKAGLKGRMPATKACGSRGSAFGDFKTALESGSNDDYPVLLVDSESAVTSETVWEHLEGRDGWSKPEGAADEQAQLMVQCMETWCVADQEALRDFFGHGLQESALPPLNDLEGRSKEDVQKKLDHATRKCGHKRKYKKGKRSFELLAELDPGVLKAKLPHFERLCNCLNEKLTSNNG